MYSRFTRSPFLFLAMMVMLLACACAEEEHACTNQPLKLQIQAVAGKQALTPQGTYTNAAGERYRVSRYRYYLTNLVLKGAAGTPDYVQPESYYLVDFAAFAPFIITLADVPEGLYAGLQYTLGVDSARNVSGAQTGALDPALGMFWTWSSGYVHFQLEGTIENPSAEFLYHIGGFSGPFNPIQTQTISFPQLYNRMEDKACTLLLRSDVNRVFSEPVIWSIASKPIVTTEDGDSRMLSNNYADMLQFAGFLYDTP